MLSIKYFVLTSNNFVMILVEKFSAVFTTLHLLYLSPRVHVSVDFNIINNYYYFVPTPVLFELSGNKMAPKRLCHFTEKLEKGIPFY